MTDLGIVRARDPYGLGIVEPPRSRARPSMERGRRKRVRSLDRSGAYVRSEIPHGPMTDPAIDATLRAAAQRILPHGTAGDMAVVVTRQDLRQKVRTRRAGRSILFVVDASGSMRCCQRMVEAKTAVLSLLSDAYLNRDRVGLVAFHGEGAREVLPLTASVDLARRCLEVLPCGGRTPLGSGLRAGRIVLERERARRTGAQPLMVILSDGKANRSLRGDPEGEALAEARAIRRSGIPLLFLDTDSTWEEPGLGLRLCRACGGRYYGVADLEARRILEIVSI